MVDAAAASPEHDETLLHLTPALESFLSVDGSTKALIAGAKGFGKTLLLQAKRRRLEAKLSGEFLPRRAAFDRPIGFTPPFSKADVIRIRNNPSFWSTTWLIAITLAAIKLARSSSDSTLRPISPSNFVSGVGALLDDAHETVTSLFTFVLALRPTQHRKAHADLQRLLAPAFRSITTNIAIFIDNIDEYFSFHLHGVPYEHSGTTDKAIWYSAQAGLASAIRDLRSQNRHISVYATIRVEALAQLLHDRELSQDLEDFVLRLQYRRDDLLQIFIRNLRAEPNENCVEPMAGDPFDRFFGRANRRLEHLHVGALEEISDYLLRHTLGRPRDLMTLGTRLSALPRERRSAANIRRVVDDAAGTIAASYLGEIQGHLDTVVDLQLLFSLITRNILTRGELAAIAKTYNEQVRKRGTPIHVFCALYKAGLLGYLAHDVGTGGVVQRFEKPAEHLLLADGVLPISTHYIIHPVLDSRIRLRAPQYIYDTLNVAGDGCIWRGTHGVTGVIKADLVAYSRILQDPDLARTFAADFAEMVANNATRIATFKIEGGDTVLLEDRNPANLVTALRKISEALAASRYRATLRAGAEFGHVEASRGLVYRTAARLEAVSAPNVLCATREFSTAASDIDARITFEVGDVLPTLQKLERRGQTYNIRKTENDPDLFKDISVLNLR